MRITIAAVVFLLLSQPAFAEAKGGAERESLRIISFNVWFGMDGEGLLRMGEYESREQKERRYQGLVAGLREYDPDILFIQEANPLPRYARRLAKDLGMDEIHAVNNGGIRIGPLGVPTNLRMGIAILAKPGLKLKRVGVYRTSGVGIVSNFFCFHLSECRVVLAGVVYPNGEPMHLFCLHIHSSAPDTEEYRTRLRELVDAEAGGAEEYDDYAKELASSFAWNEEDISRSIPYIEEITRDGRPFVVAGDFNAYRPTFPALGEFMMKLRLLDSFAVANPGRPGYSWDTARNPNTRFDGTKVWANGKAKNPLELLQAEYDGTEQHRVDYIFLSPHFAREDVLSSELVFTEPYDGVYVSDHFGVMTEVGLNKQE